MKNIKQAGFTMIELAGALAVLGGLLLAASPLV